MADAKALYEIVAPVWQKWPETKPDRLEYEPGNNVWTWVGTEVASDLCIAALLRWLVNRVRGVYIEHNDFIVDDEQWYILDQSDMEGATMLGHGKTLLEALCAAAMSLSLQEKP